LIGSFVAASRNDSRATASVTPSTSNKRSPDESRRPTIPTAFAFAHARFQRLAYGFCADGGLFANNPGGAALTTLIESGVPLDSIWMLSLGTGNTQNCYPASLINAPGASSFGAIYWMWPVSQPQTPVAGQPYTPSFPLMDAVFDATAQMDVYYCSRLLPGRYQRANVPLSQPVPLDDFSPTAIASMLDSTSTYIQQSSEWAAIRAWIGANFG
jgi:hypothetical protein